MADGRSKAVLGELADLSSRSNYGIDLVRNLREPLGAGDIIDVPSISALTVATSGASDVSAQTITTNVLSLNANLQPMINMEIPLVAKMQLLDGNWAGQVAEQATIQLKNSMDNLLMRDYLALSLCWVTGAAGAGDVYHINPEADSLSEDDILNGKAALLSNDGVEAQNIIFVVSPYAEASIASIAGFIPNGKMAESGMLGIPQIGTVFGVPVFSSNSIKRNQSVATTAATAASSALTCTVATGHGFVPGQVVTTAGLTTNSTNVVVTSTTATTVVIPTTAGDGAFGDGVGTITDASSRNLMMDKSQIFAAQQKLPSVRTVPYFNRTSDALQISSVWGRIGRAGRCYTVHSPGSSA